MGKAIRTSFYDNIFINLLLEGYDSENDNWIVTDVRTINEYYAIKEQGGIVIGIKKLNRQSNFAPSETMTDTVIEQADFIIENNFYLSDWQSDLVEQILNFKKQFEI